MTALGAPADPREVGLLGSVSELASCALTLARRFAAGATLWSVAPGDPHHAHHVALEFVHPVIVGTRSLPAVAIDDADPVGTARLLVRPGDVLVAIGSGDDPTIAALLARGEAWGVATVLLASGPPPRPGSADHVVWVGADDDGSTLMSYHLLWELTHVVFEHPGLLAPPAPVCDDEVCITCSDEGRVVEVRALLDDHTAEVLAAGRVEQVDLSLVSGVGPGDLLLVHAGVALATLPTGGPT
jgi:hydrogenase maturation factor